MDSGNADPAVPRAPYCLADSRVSDGLTKGLVAKMFHGSLTASTQIADLPSPERPVLAAIQLGRAELWGQRNQRVIHANHLAGEQIWSLKTMPVLARQNIQRLPTEPES